MISETYSLKKKKKKKEPMNTNISIKRKKKKKHKNEIKYPLAWMYPSMEEYFRNQEIFSLKSKIFHLKKVVLKTKFSRTSLT